MVVISMSLLLLAFFGQSACSKREANLSPVMVSDTATTPKDTSSPSGGGSAVTGSSKRYLALGDSYTIGESVSENARYPKQLQDSLAKYGIKLSAVDIIARTGWTTGDLLYQLQATPPVGTYDLVTLLIGVNNQYQGLSLSQYNTEFNALLEKSKQYAGGNCNKVIVISIPDYSVVPFSYYLDTTKIRTQLQQFNTTNKNITLNNGIKYVDVFALSQEAKYNKALVASDSLHFSGLEYAKWTSLLVPLAKEILK